ncbi:MAG: hypothetical protein Q8Q14_01745, partial [Gemmatimonadales bacterium]|nr:hypothetical protein [Gemmatimonadales bacterium]
MITQTRYGQASAGSAPGEPEAHRAPDRGARRGANTYLTVSTCRALGDAAVARAEADGVSVSTLVRRALAEWARRARV